jgi:hypothetical protein
MPHDCFLYAFVITNYWYLHFEFKILSLWIHDDFTRIRKNVINDEIWSTSFHLWPNLKVIFLECFTTRSYEYSGFKSTTANGITCQRWDSQTPHRHINTDVNKYPENSLADAANYCRDPDRTGKPWCYTIMSSTRWQLCGINRCEKGM